MIQRLKRLAKFSVAKLLKPIPERGLRRSSSLAGRRPSLFPPFLMRWREKRREAGYTPRKRERRGGWGMFPPPFLPPSPPYLAGPGKWISLLLLLLLLRRKEKRLSSFFSEPKKKTTFFSTSSLSRISSSSLLSGSL